MSIQPVQPNRSGTWTWDGFAPKVCLMSIQPLRSLGIRDVDMGRFPSPRLFHVHSTGPFAVMASDTCSWGGVLSPRFVSCPFNRFSFPNGIRHVDMGQRSVSKVCLMSIQPVQFP
ncbi:hypothetical protein AVEN_176322-1 [Araneus ventricosus]|uniref:Uncharacterized protein n=1 Tax=Araneus ventricosus TaxID=182803 RepID=A0A4Y2N9F9_ARAVE|nr:hypothetical protein AVEN_176322-1 [Araneus ventricosus]